MGLPVRSTTGSANASSSSSKGDVRPPLSPPTPLPPPSPAAGRRGGEERRGGGEQVMGGSVSITSRKGHINGYVEGRILQHVFPPSPLSDKG